MHIRTHKLSIFFGNADEKIEPLHNNSLSPSATTTLKTIMRNLKAQSLTFAKQEHGSAIADLSGASPLPLLLDSRADILSTKIAGRAIGLFTADCLPLICYDPQNHAVTVVHAGWKGTLAHATQKAITFMLKRYHSKVENLLCFLGPSAHDCCYEVKNDFIENVRSHEHAKLYESFLSFRSGSSYFDVSAANKAQLLAAGIAEHNIDTSCNLCTICNPQFCSHRRAPGLRQISIALLD